MTELQWNFQKKWGKKVFLLARIKLNSKENIISKAWIDNEISHEKFTIIMNEAENFHKLEENIIMMKSQRSGIEKDKIIEGGKKMGTDKIIKQNEKISNSFESQI